MDKNMLVKVRVPCCDDSECIATAYPVMRNRIITAYHALFPEGCEREGNIVLSWPGLENEPTVEIGDEQILWRDKECYDIAVVECEFPKGVTGAALSTALKPIDDTRWISEAFPRTGENEEGERDSTPLGGRVYSMVDKAKRFQVGVDDKAKKAWLWKGASGAPVMVDGHLLGVMVTSHIDFDGGRLEAAPMWQLLVNPDFRAALGFKEQDQEKLEALKKEITGLLEEHSTIFDALKNAMAHDSCNDAPKLTQSYFNLEIERATEVISAVATHLNDIEDDATRKTALKHFKSIAYATLPQFYQFEAHGNENAFTGTGIVSLPATTTTIAELIMAYRDGAPADFKTDENEDIYPSGRYRILGEVEAGIDSDGQQRAEDVQYSVANKFGAGAGVANFNHAFHEYITAYPFVAKQHQKKPLELKMQFANQMLSSLFKKEGRRYYFLIDETECEDDQQAWINAVAQLKQNFPEIEFVCMSRDTTLALKQNQQSINLMNLFKFTKD